MIPFTTLEYEIDEDPKNAISRLKWAVEEVEPSWEDYMNWSSTPDTNKFWFGQIDHEKQRFSLEPAGSFLQRKMTVIVKGKVEHEVRVSKVKVRIGLDYSSFLWLSIVFLLTALVISDIFLTKEFNSPVGLFLWITVGAILPIISIFKSIKRSEKRLDVIFG